MTDTLIDTIKKALSCSVTEITFDDNFYHDESFIEKSIRNGFAGWFSEPDLVKHVDFVLKHCQAQPHSKILDAACGHGRHAHLLSQRGHDVVGADISERLISYLRETYGDKAQFERKPFHDIDCSSVFDLVIVLGNSLSLIPRAEIGRALRNLSESLRIGGKLFVELDNRDYFVKNEAGKRYWQYHGQRWITLSEHYYDDMDRLEKTVDVGVDLQTMEVDRLPTTKCLYDHNELSGLIATADLRELNSFCDWDESPIVDDSPSLLLIAERDF